jgi:hypothetical protein
MPPLFFRIKVILPKRPHFFIAKTTHLIIFFYSSEDTCTLYHVWCLVIQDLSSKFILVLYICIPCLSYIGRQRTCIYVYNINHSNFEKLSFRDKFIRLLNSESKDTLICMCDFLLKSHCFG